MKSQEPASGSRIPNTKAPNTDRLGLFNELNNGQRP